jgi:triosephosphate isomerase
MKRTLIVANWKMNLNVSEASLLVHRLDKELKTYRDIEIVLAPSMLALQPISLQIDRRKFRLAAQNAYHKDSGGFTGEVSFNMLDELVHYAIIGHSERRIYFEEPLPLIRDKVAAAIRNGITPVLCVGETQSERRLGETRQVIHDQVTTALQNLTAEEVENMAIAYEPVWAITTFGGILAKPEEAKKGMDFVRKQVAELYGKKAAQNVRVLYGGSVDDQTVRSYAELEGCDGAMVGAASINYKKFIGLVNSIYQMHRDRTPEKAK